MLCCVVLYMHTSAKSMNLEKDVTIRANSQGNCLPLQCSFICMLRYS